MELLGGIFLIVLFIFACKKLRGFLSAYGEEKAREKEQTQRQVQEVLDLLRKDPEQEEPIDHRENLIRANRELIQKWNTAAAIEKELGINLYEDPSK
jgi:polyhydroxyalkanoate synthesis regulator protein